MRSYSQNDPRWKHKKLGTSNETIGNYGCAITALGNLADKTPDEVNTLLKDNGGFLNGNLVIWQRACDLLGLNWNGQGPNAPKFPTIMQVTRSDFPMHFVVDLGNGLVIDSWDGQTKKNPYRFVMYKNATAKGVEKMSTWNEGDRYNFLSSTVGKKYAEQAKAKNFFGQENGKESKEAMYTIMQSKQYLGWVKESQSGEFKEVAEKLYRKG